MESPAYIQHALAVSKPVTVDVSFFFVKSCSNLKILDLLKPHLQRLRSLLFDGRNIVEHPSNSSLIMLLQDHDVFTALETVELPFAFTRPLEPHREGDFVDIRLTSERFPSLRALTITRIKAPHDLQVYARLRKLSLDSCICDFSFSHFMAAMIAAGTNIEILELVSVLQRIQGGHWVEGISARRPIRDPIFLRCLKSLKLAAHPPVHTSRFLSHVLLPPTASIYISGDLGKVKPRDPVDTVSAMLPPDPSSSIPALAQANVASVRAHGQYSIACSFGPHPALEAAHLVTLQVRSSIVLNWQSTSSHVARDLLSVLGSAPLTTLDFWGDCSCVVAETWAEIFARYPLLEIVNLGMDCTTETAFAGLMHAAPAPTSLVPCPNLRTVGVSGLFAEDALGVTLQCLRDRAEKGHHLETIGMNLWGHDDEEVEQCKALLETKYVPQLQALVTQSCVCSCGESVR